MTKHDIGAVHAPFIIRAWGTGFDFTFTVRDTQIVDIPHIAQHWYGKTFSRFVQYMFKYDDAFDFEVMQTKGVR